MKEKERLIFALKRALWTFAESMLGFVTVGMAVQDIDWKMALSVSATAVIASLLKSITAGMPEEMQDE